VITGSSSAHPRALYAAWLSFSLLGLVGIVAGKRSRKAWGVLSLFVLTASLLLVPACGNTNPNNATTTPNGITPANNYTFTIVGVDTNGVVSSNTGSTTSAGPTVTLGVTAPATH
jgi:hypothetical protein